MENYPTQNNWNMVTSAQERAKEYEKMTPDERRAKIEQFVSTNCGTIKFGENYGHGYMQFSIEDDGPKTSETNVNLLQEEAEQKLIKIICGRLRNRGHEPIPKELKDGWDSLVQNKPEQVLEYLSAKFRDRVPDAFNLESTVALKNLDINIAEIGKEHKIHLQPRKDKIFQTVEHLVTAIRNNESLRASIKAFKVATEYDENDTETFPELVIYVKQGAENYGQAITDA